MNTDDRNIRPSPWIASGDFYGDAMEIKDSIDIDHEQSMPCENGAFDQLLPDTDEAAFGSQRTLQTTEPLSPSNSQDLCPYNNEDDSKSGTLNSEPRISCDLILNRARRHFLTEKTMQCSQTADEYNGTNNFNLSDVITDIASCYYDTMQVTSNGQLVQQEEQSMQQDPHPKEEQNRQTHNKKRTRGKPKRAKCEHCLVSLWDSREFSSHMKSVHTSDGKYPCYQCDYSGGTIQVLTAHVKALHSGAGYHIVCQVCGKIVTRQANLKKHQSSMH